MIYFGISIALGLASFFTWLSSTAGLVTGLIVTLGILQINHIIQVERSSSTSDITANVSNSSSFPMTIIRMGQAILMTGVMSALLPAAAGLTGTNQCVPLCNPATGNGMIPPTDNSTMLSRFIGNNRGKIIIAAAVVAVASGSIGMSLIEEGDDW